MYTTNLPPNVDQGVILKDVYFYGPDLKTWGFVLTPTCDFEHDKVELVHLCALFPASRIANHLKSSKKESLKQIILHKFPRYQWFMPLLGVFPPLIADFQFVTSIMPKELEALDRVAALVSPYREQVPARYAAYMSRVGTPDFGKEDIDGWINLVMQGLGTA